MTTLALEFSSSQRSVAVFTGGQLVGQARQHLERSTRCIGLIQSALDEAGLQPSDVEAAVVGLGPGSYTGIRMAIALLQGWQLARSVLLFGLSSADAIAHQGWLKGGRGPCSIIIDAQRQQYYRADYQLNSSRPTRVRPVGLINEADVQAALSRGDALAGPDLEVAFPRITALFPDAAALPPLLSPEILPVAGERLEPIYLRATSFVKAAPPRLIPPRMR